MLAEVNSLIRNAMGCISDTLVKYDRKTVPVSMTTSLLVRPLMTVVSIKNAVKTVRPLDPALFDIQNAQN